MFTGVFRNGLVQSQSEGCLARNCTLRRVVNPANNAELKWSAWRCAPKLGECFKSEVKLVFHLRKFYLTNLHWKQQLIQLEYKCTYTHMYSCCFFFLLNYYYDLQILTAVWSMFITTVLQLVPRSYWNVRCCIMSLCQMTIPSCIKTKWTPQMHVYKIRQLFMNRNPRPTFGS